MNYQVVSCTTFNDGTTSFHVETVPMSLEGAAKHLEIELSGKENKTLMFAALKKPTLIADIELFLQPVG